MLFFIFKNIDQYIPAYVVPCLLTVSNSLPHDIELIIQQFHIALQHLFGNGVVLHEVLRAQWSRAEASNRDQRAIEGDGRNDRIESTAIGESGVDRRAGFIDSTSRMGRNPLNDFHHVTIVVELDGGPLELAVPGDWFRSLFPT